MLTTVFENILIMVLTIVFLLAGAYLFLMILGWGLKLKSRGREQSGLNDLWIESQKDATSRAKPINKTDTRD